jgi:hypothetical protein
MTPTIHRLAGVFLALFAACGGFRRPVPVDPDATFAAHREHRGFVVDRLQRGQAARILPGALIRLHGEPTWVLEADGETTAAFWVEGGDVLVRHAVDAGGPLAGRVVPAWDDGAVRLHVRNGADEIARTDVFRRTGGGTGPTVLTRAAQTVLDVRGTYEASVQDARGAKVGWMRVRIGPYQEAPQIYEASLPDTIPPPLVAAATVALGIEIDWIEEHAIDVYRGPGGSLERSVPGPR